MMLTLPSSNFFYLFLTVVFEPYYNNTHIIFTSAFSLHLLFFTNQSLKHVLNYDIEMFSLI
jgi:hypothetical protein